MLPFVGVTPWELAEGVPVFMAERIVDDCVRVVNAAILLHNGHLLRGLDKPHMMEVRWILESRKNWEFYVRSALNIEILQCMNECMLNHKQFSKFKGYQPPSGIPIGLSVNFDGAPHPDGYKRPDGLCENWQHWLLVQIAEKQKQYPSAKLPWLGELPPQWLKHQQEK